MNLMKQSVVAPQIPVAAPILCPKVKGWCPPPPMLPTPHPALCSQSGAAAGWPVPSLQPLMADLPRLVGPACFCLLSGSVPLQSHIATGDRSSAFPQSEKRKKKQNSQSHTFHFEQHTEAVSSLVSFPKGSFSSVLTHCTEHQLSRNNTHTHFKTS